MGGQLGPEEEPPLRGAGFTSSSPILGGAGTTFDLFLTRLGRQTSSKHLEEPRKARLASSRTHLEESEKVPGLPKVDL